MFYLISFVDGLLESALGTVPFEHTPIARCADIPVMGGTILRASVVDGPDGSVIVDFMLVGCLVGVSYRLVRVGEVVRVRVRVSVSVAVL